MKYTGQDFAEVLLARTSIPPRDYHDGIHAEDAIVDAALRIAARVMTPGVIAGGMITLDRTMPTDEQFEAAIRTSLTSTEDAT